MTYSTFAVCGATTSIQFQNIFLIPAGNPEHIQQLFPSPSPHTPMLSGLSCVQLFVTPSGFFVHGILQATHWSGLSLPSSKGSSRPRNQTPASLGSPALAGRFFTTSATWEALFPPTTGHHLLSVCGFTYSGFFI